LIASAHWLKKKYSAARIIRPIVASDAISLVVSLIFAMVILHLKLNFYLDRKITLYFILVNNILLIILLTGGFGGVILLVINGESGGSA
jgi:hypothetical protein